MFRHCLQTNAGLVTLKQQVNGIPNPYLFAIYSIQRYITSELKQRR
jgi:hypothetical protein